MNINFWALVRLYNVYSIDSLDPKNIITDQWLKLYKAWIEQEIPKHEEKIETLKKEIIETLEKIKEAEKQYEELKKEKMSERYLKTQKIIKESKEIINKRIEEKKHELLKKAGLQIDPNKKLTKKEKSERRIAIKKQLKEIGQLKRTLHEENNKAIKKFKKYIADVNKKVETQNQRKKAFEKQLKGMKDKLKDSIEDKNKLIIALTDEKKLEERIINKIKEIQKLISQVKQKTSHILPRIIEGVLWAFLYNKIRNMAGTDQDKLDEFERCIQAFEDSGYMVKSYKILKEEEFFDLTNLYPPGSYKIFEGKLSEEALHKIPPYQEKQKLQKKQEAIIALGKKMQAERNKLLRSEEIDHLDDLINQELTKFNTIKKMIQKLQLPQLDEYQIAVASKEYGPALHSLIKRTKMSNLPPEVEQGSYGYEYDYPNRKITTKFTTCFESAMLDFLSILWYNPNTQKYDNSLFPKKILAGEGFTRLRNALKYIHKAKEKGIPYTINYANGKSATSIEYLKEQIKPKEIENIQPSEFNPHDITKAPINQEWINIVSGLNNEKKKYTNIIYSKKIPNSNLQYEIRSKVQNFINLCNYLFGTKAKKIEDLNGVFDTSDRKITFSLEQEEENYIITVHIETKKNEKSEERELLDIDYDLTIEIQPRHTILEAKARETASFMPYPSPTIKKIFNKIIHENNQMLIPPFILLTSKNLLKEFTNELPFYYTLNLVNNAIKLEVIQKSFEKWDTLDKKTKNFIYNLIKKIPKDYYFKNQVGEAIINLELYDKDKELLIELKKNPAPSILQLAMKKYIENKNKTLEKLIKDNATQHKSYQTIFQIPVLEEKDQLTMLKFFNITKKNIDKIKDENGDTLLIVAIKKENLPFAKYLIDIGINPNIVNKKGESALFTVIDKIIDFYDSIRSEVSDGIEESLAITLFAFHKPYQKLIPKLLKKTDPAIIKNTLVLIDNLKEKIENEDKIIIGRKEALQEIRDSLKTQLSEEIESPEDKE